MPPPAQLFSPGGSLPALIALRLPAVQTSFRHTTRSYPGRPVAMMPTAVRHSDSLARTLAQLRYLSQSSRRLKNADKPPHSESPKSSAHSSSKPGAGAQPKRQSTLDQMGATRTVKIVVIVFICIYGTMETIFYAGHIYRYMTRKSEPE